MFRNWLLLNRNWVLQNFPFLEDDFDALDDYTLFCKFIGYVYKIAITTDKFYEELKDDLYKMYEDGKFDSLIEEIVNLQLTFTYPSIASMKEATNLVNGSFAKTTGFYSYNDGGGSYYYVRTKTENDTIDDVTIVGLSDETLIAELLIQDEMNVKEFGAKGDGETDDTEAIQLCLDTCKNIIIRDGTYMIDAVDGSLAPTSNSNIKIINATLKAITNNETNYAIMRIYEADNVIIEGGIFEGDRTTHTGESGEWGHCIIVRSCENVTLKNITLKDAWGDGLYVVNSSNVSTYNIIADNNRRNGYSIISVDGFTSNNDYISNTNGTAPEDAVDIEPNEATEILKNVIFNNLRTYNNTGCGFDIHLANQTNDTPTINIVLNNYYDEASTIGIQVYKNQYTKGNITLNEPMLLNNKKSGIGLRQCYNSALNVEINKPKIINCNTIDNTSPKYSSAISMFIEENDTQLSLGNVTIIEPYITSHYTGSGARYMYIFGTSDYNVLNFKLINPLNNDGNKSLTLQYINNLVFKDDYEVFTLDTNNTMELSAYNTISKLTNTTYQTSKTNTITSVYPIGREMTFINTNASGYDIGIKLPTDCYLRGFSNVASPTLIVPNNGNSVTIKRISSTDFIVTNYVGDISVSE